MITWEVSLIRLPLVTLVLWVAQVGMLMQELISLVMAMFLGVTTLVMMLQPLGT